MMSDGQPWYLMRFELGKFAPTIVPTFIEAFLSGLLVAVYGGSVYTTLYTQQPREVRTRNRIFLGLNTLVFLGAIVHVALSLARCFSVYVVGETMYDMAGDIAPSQEGIPFSANDRARLAIYVTLMWVVDWFMLYRLTVFWGRKWTVLFFPVCSTLADAVLGYMGVAYPFTFIIFFWTSWATATLCSALIFGRSVKRGGRVIDALVQSTAVYPLVLLVPVFSFLFEPVWIGYVILAPPIVAMTASLIVMQLTLESAGRSEGVLPGFRPMDDVETSRSALKAQN